MWARSCGIARWWKALPSALVVLFLGCAEGEPKTRAGLVCEDCNVILIVSDTLRAQQLGLYGYSRDTSPTLDSLGDEGAFFEYATSQAACTYPSAHSLLTSRYPVNFLGLGSNKIPPEIKPISEIFQEKGYRTIGVSGSPIVIGESNSFSQGGFDRGFEVWEQCECTEPDCKWIYTPHASCINEKAFEHISPGTPFFMYLHYMDAHTPNAAPYQSFSRPYEGSKSWVRDGIMNPIEAMLYSGGEDAKLEARDIEHLLDLYDDEVRYFDDSIAQLLQELEKHGLEERTIIVIAADHGNEFMEHESVKHCHTLYDTETRTPLIIRIPGVKAGRLEAVAENNDILPTLLDYVGIDASEQHFDGVSLRSSLEGGEESRSYAYSSQNELRSISDGRYQLIYDIGSEEVLLFDRQSDPDQLRSVAKIESSKREELQAELMKWIQSVEGRRDAEDLEEAREVSRQTEEHLKAIGYIE
jgi:arylsulfatase